MPVDQESGDRIQVVLVLLLLGGVMVVGLPLGLVVVLLLCANHTVAGAVKGCCCHLLQKKQKPLRFRM